MHSEVMQLLAALANERTRLRFAQLVLADRPLQSSPRDDRLLLASGAVFSNQDGETELDPDALRRLVATAGSHRTTHERPILDRLPKRSSERSGLLMRIASDLFAEADVLSEKRLGEGLAGQVSDIALFRRALVDEGFVVRNPDGSQYRMASR